MRNLKYRWMGAMLIALLAMTATSCTLFNRGDRAREQRKAEFDAANKMYAETVNSRDVAFTIMRLRRIDKKVPDAEWAEYRMSEKASARSQIAVDADLTVWGKTTFKPPSFDGNFALYKEDVAEMIVASKKFEGGGQ